VVAAAAVAGEVAVAVVAVAADVVVRLPFYSNLDSLLTLL
jgi:hypothetical protein